MKKKIILGIFVFVISINCFITLGRFYPLYPIILGIFLLYYLIKKEWFEVSTVLSFLLFATVPLMYLPLIIFLIIAFSIPSLRKTLSWLRIGKQSKLSKILVTATCFISVIALLIWANNSSYLGAGSNAVKKILIYNHYLIVVAFVPLFAIINSLFEEFMFRGILQENLKQNFNKESAVIILQAIPFGAFHYAIGFPNGIIGFFMVFIWGAILGFLRERTNGLLAPMICHIFADLSIGYYLYYSALKLLS